uniref:Uncharacterized protein n=1 Tax=Hyaloperonospora arabidopsidis (strain Emoy2) TaxID=559515 RepID=M4B9S8_HYAAE
MLFTTKTCCRRCISCFGCYWCCSCLAQCDTRQTNALFSLDQLENNVLYTIGKRFWCALPRSLTSRFCKRF